MPRKHLLSGLAVVALLTLALTYIEFTPYFEHPNQPGGIWGDAYKNAAVVAYHAWHDTSYVHYDGMNFPFGEHILTTDGQPLVSNALQWLERRGISTRSFTFTVINWAMLVSLILTPPLLFLFFARYSLPVAYAVGMALAVTALHPMMERMGPHYSLAQPLAVVGVIFLLVSFDRKPSWFKALSLGLVVLAAGLMHPYFLVVLGMPTVFFMGVRYLRERQWRALPVYLGYGGLMLGIPALFFLWWLILPDAVADRSPAPWGFFSYRAIPQGILFSPFQPHWMWIHENWTDILGLIDNIERRTYLGIVGNVGMLAILVIALIRRGRIPFLEKELQTLYWAGLLALLFASGFPFFIGGLENRLQDFGFYQQFRSIGRLAWFSYFAINLVVVVWWYRLLAGRVWAPVVWALLTGVFLFEGYHFIQSKIDLNPEPVPEWEAGDILMRRAGIQPEKYQAILGLPFYSIGSENFWVDAQGYIQQKTMTLSMETGLPLVNHMMTRTSLGQVFQQLQLVSEPYRPPSVLEHYPDNRPLLLVVHKEYEAAERDAFWHLADEGEILFEDEKLSFRKLDLSVFEQLTKAQRKAAWVSLPADSLQQSQMVYRSFEHHANTVNGYRGRGAALPLGSKKVLYEGQLATGKAREYVFSCWVYLLDDRRARTRIFFEQFDAEGNLTSWARLPVQKMVRVFDPIGWVLIEHTFQAAPGHRLVISYDNVRLAGEPMRLDEMLIRPSGSLAGWQDGDQFMVNNRWFLTPRLEEEW